MRKGLSVTCTRIAEFCTQVALKLHYYKLNYRQKVIYHMSSTVAVRIENFILETNAKPLKR